MKERGSEGGGEEEIKGEIKLEGEVVEQGGRGEEREKKRREGTKEDNTWRKEGREGGGRTMH